MGRLGIEVSSEDLHPVVGTLVDCASHHCKTNLHQSINNIRSHIEETHYNLFAMTTTNPHHIGRLISASLITFKNYIEHKYQPVTTTPNTVESDRIDSTQSDSSTSSERVMAQLLDFSDISSTTSETPVTNAVNDSSGPPGTGKKNRKSEKIVQNLAHTTHRNVSDLIASLGKKRT